MTAVSLIGLGAMGSALARTLIEAGHRVTVWNRSPGKAEALVAAGASVVPDAAAAVAASPVTITCIASHGATRDVLATAPAALAGKTVIELSTGNAAEVEVLSGFVKGVGADLLVGMINAYPTGIGEAGTTIITAGSEAAWKAYGTMILELGGSSTYVSDNPAALAALFAALFTARQGFMFGMLYGAALCEKAGVPLQLYADQMPATLKLVNDYAATFAATAPAQKFADSPASLATYVGSLDDSLTTFESLGARCELPRLMRDLAHRGMDEGLAGEELTALVKVLRQP
jgi:3-hydroxyisobutyrate dehydrogenase-like beta-hydroxyacid dehydrogenase